jgi:hypothetical protein
VGGSTETGDCEGDDVPDGLKRCGEFLSRWEFGKPAVG